MTTEQQQERNELYRGSYDADTRIRSNAGWASHYLEKLLDEPELPAQGRKDVQTFLGRLEEIKDVGAKDGVD